MQNWDLWVCPLRHALRATSPTGRGFVRAFHASSPTAVTSIQHTDKSKFEKHRIKQKINPIQVFLSKTVSNQSEAIDLAHSRTYAELRGVGNFFAKKFPT